MTHQPTATLGLSLICGLGLFAFQGVASASDEQTSYKHSEKLAHAIPDLRNERDVKTKKRKFFNALRPMVEIENQRILEQRQFLLNLKTKGSINQQDKQKVAKLLKSYRLERKKDGSIPWKALLKRVDTVPLELVLSQAANESAWGTSRFARKANNLFGQWCFSKGCGLVPARRNAGSTHEVAAFSSPQLSVRSYLRNLNTGRVYKDLRNIRAKARAEGRTASAHELAAGLIKYSERGHEYVKEIRAMIKYNGKYMRGES
ncbi:MAG: glucosaminidase domain-containing protein [Ghiorsea sp.]|nr:glucosaminidase domain-containing protein [Ghiorsea sp.]